MTDNIEINSMEITLNDTNLTKQQKAILQKVYTSTKTSIIDIFNKLDKDSDVAEISNSIFRTVCLVMKTIEKVKLNRKILTGEEKKIIVLELVRISIISEIEDETTKAIVLNMYNMSGEDVLETVIDVTRNVNVTLKRGISKLFKCCKN
uniref:Uncharacterized protein n=1 Tax=viral metagenome TaxID=1070528 RepID=A0A6C0J0V2_9ZZZZ